MFGPKGMKEAKRPWSMGGPLCWGFSGEDVTKIVIDGYAQVLFTVAGTEGVIGMVTEVKAQGKKITRDTTVGTPVVGFDLMHSGKLVQTTTTDVANMAGAVQLDKSRIIGAQTTSVITAPTGRKLYMNFEVDQTYSNKSESFVQFEVTKPGQPVSSLTTFIVAST